MNSYSTPRVSLCNNDLPILQHVNCTTFDVSEMDELRIDGDSLFIFSVNIRSIRRNFSMLESF